MTPQVPVKRAMVPSRRSLAALVSVVAIVLGLLSVFAALAGSADAKSNRASATRSAAASGPNSLLAQLLAALAKAQGVKPKPAPSSTPTSTAPSSSAPSSSAPTSTAPSSSAPSSSAPTSSAPSSTAPSSSAPTSSAPTSSDPGDPSVAGSTLVMSEDFNGSQGAAPQTGFWKNELGGRWGGGSELECYTDSRDNSALDGNGDLVITARYSPGHVCTDATDNYTSARLSTEHMATTQYGQIRVRAKLPVDQGVWPAIWLLGDDTDQVGWPNGGEIDMMEAIGENDHTIYGTVHGPSANGPWQIGQGYDVPGSISNQFHIYGLDWSPTQMVLSVDGHPYETITKSEVLAKGYQWVFDRPFYMVLNVAVGGPWAGAPRSNANFPQSMTIDYVRVYK